MIGELTRSRTRRPGYPSGSIRGVEIMMRRWLVLGASVVGLSLVPAVHAEIQAGAAVRVITPDKFLPVSGGMGVPKPSKEKRGELTARALVFRKGDVSVAIVGLDLLGFPSVLCDRVRAK